MEPSLIIIPVAGGVIGYFTNWLAIKMLFRPHTAKYIFGVHVPFTPGLIPKEKERLAKSLGNTVGNHLLTEEVLIKSLVKDEVIDSLDKVLTNTFDTLNKSDLTFSEFLNKIFGETSDKAIEGFKDVVLKNLEQVLSNQGYKEEISTFIYKKIIELLEKDISNLPKEKIMEQLKVNILSLKKEAYEKSTFKTAIEKALWQKLKDLEGDERKISEVVSPSTVAQVKDYLSLKTPDIVNSLLKLTENPEFEDFLKIKIKEAVGSIAGSFVGMFIKTDDIYVKAMEGITTYFNDSKNMPEIEKNIDLCVNKAIEHTVGEMAFMATSQFRENSINKCVSFIYDEMFKEENIDKIFIDIDNYLELNKDKTFLDILKKIEPYTENKVRECVYNITDSLISQSLVIYLKDFIEGKFKTILNTKTNIICEKISLCYFDSVKKWLINSYLKAIDKVGYKILSAFNINKVVEEQINSFSTEYTEELILAVAKKELGLITALGGVLGFIIGLLPVLMNLL